MPLPESLRARWSLDEASGTRADSIASSDLTDNNTVGQAAGKLGDAASFNGSNEYLSVADNADLSFANGTSFFVACWLNVTTLVSGATPLNKGGLIFGATSFEYALEFLQQGANINLLWLLSNNSSSSALNCSAGVLSTGAWHLVIAWYDHAGPLMYIQLDNGTPVSQAAPSGGTSDQTHAFNIGSSGAGGGHFHGLIDEVLVGEGVPTEAERDMLWNGGAGMEWPYAGMHPVMPLTRIDGLAMYTQLAGSFSGKTTASTSGPHPVDRLTRMDGLALYTQLAGSFAGKTAAGADTPRRAWRGGYGLWHRSST